MAPELLGEREDGSPVRPSKESDVFSFGGIMLQVCLENFRRPTSLLAPILGPHQQNSLFLSLK
jgi:hypothetical protein